MSTRELTPEVTSSSGAFRYLWLASLISTFGDGALLAALPLLAASLTRDPRLISAVAVTGRLPWLTLALFGGVIVDRLDRHRLMLWTQVGQMLLVILITLAVILDISWIWMLYLFAFAIGCGDVLFQGASQAIVPTIVNREGLDTANGRLVAVEAIARDFLGPPAGSILFALAVAAPFGLDGVSFALSVLLITRIKPPPSARAAPRRAVLAEIREGLRWLAGVRLLRTLTLITAGGNFCEAMALSLLVLYTREILGVGNVGYGVLLAAMAGGGVIGGLFSARVVRRLGARTVAMAVEVISPAAWLAIAAFGRNAIVVVALFTVFSLALSMWSVVTTSTRQRMVPNELLGRVATASRMLAYGATPLGALAGGFIAAKYGLVAPWLVGGVLSSLVAAVSLPMLWRWDA